jgi:hypothetical protein
VNYTWSHAIDNSSSVFNVSNSDNTGSSYVCDITNPDACRGDADFDIRHLVNITASGNYHLAVAELSAQICRDGSTLYRWLEYCGYFSLLGPACLRNRCQALSLLCFSAEGQAVILPGTDRAYSDLRSMTKVVVSSILPIRTLY